MYTVDIDTGGTFTDGFFRDGEAIEITKVPTTTHDVTECFIDCIEAGAERLGVSTESLLRDTTTLRFSTTIGTNMVIERTGSEVGLIVTEGAADSLYADGDPTIGGFVDDDMIETVPERTTDAGEVDREVRTEEVIPAVKRLLSNGARIVAVALANAYYNPHNERRLKSIIEEEYPRHYLGSVQVMLSTEVTDRPDDYLRMTSTVLNSYLHKSIRSSLYTAGDKARDQGYENPLLIGHSSGGSARVAKTTAINTYNSGPACGVIGAQYLADLYDIDHLISTDMGGTSIDLSVITNGAYDYTLRPEVHGTPIDIPLIQVETAGVGGGSIASVDDGSVTVGPESAGSNPGPACYGLGGAEPTVTDADVVLGYINPDYFAGGSWQLEAGRAHDAIETAIAEPLSLSVEEAAWRVKRTADGNIAADLESLIADQDFDGPFSVLAYGGAGATHCVGYTAQLETDHVLTSPYSPVFSAFGSATLDVVHRYTRPLYATIEAWDDGTTLTGTGDLEDTIGDLVDEAFRDMAGEGFDEDEVSLSLEVIVRHDGRDRLLEVSGDWGSQPGDAIASSLEAAGHPATAVDVTMLQLKAVGPTLAIELPRSAPGEPDPSSAFKGHRETFWDGGHVETPVYQREDLGPGNVVEGIAIIESEYTTYVVEDGWTYEIDERHHGHFRRE